MSIELDKLKDCKRVVESIVDNDYHSMKSLALAHYIENNNKSAVDAILYALDHVITAMVRAEAE